MSLYNSLCHSRRALEHSYTYSIIRNLRVCVYMRVYTLATQWPSLCSCNFNEQTSSVFDSLDTATFRGWVAWFGGPKTSWPFH